jgi:hypothetical protein
LVAASKRKEKLDAQDIFYYTKTAQQKRRLYPLE